jgi:hypothetical protein
MRGSARFGTSNGRIYQGAASTKRNRKTGYICQVKTTAQENNPKNNEEKSRPYLEEEIKRNEERERK